MTLANRSHAQGGVWGIDPGELGLGSGDTTIIGELSPIDSSSSVLFGTVDDRIRPPLAYTGFGTSRVLPRGRA